MRKERLLLFIYAVFFGVGLLIALVPFLGEVSFKYEKLVHAEKFTEDYYLEQYLVLAGQGAGSDVSVPIFEQLIVRDSVIIPVIGVDSPLFFGEREEILSMGSWLRPMSYLPGFDGNTIISAHRFGMNQFLGGPFYNLPKLKEGDLVIVWWQKEFYEYRVFESFEVSETEVSIEDPVWGKDILTLYTCVGWKSDRRFVVRALRDS